jgi:hypothetical protein
MITRLPSALDTGNHNVPALSLGHRQPPSDPRRSPFPSRETSHRTRADPPMREVVPIADSMR